jgi:hypothetical protein
MELGEALKATGLKAARRLSLFYLSVGVFPCERAVVYSDCAHRARTAR